MAATAAKEAPKSAKKEDAGSWRLFGGGGPSENDLRKQLREYEQRLQDMREIASRQAADISSLRTVAETHLTAAAAKGQADLAELAKSVVSLRWQGFESPTRLALRLWAGAARCT